MSVIAKIDGSDHEAKFKFSHEVQKFEAGKPFEAKLAWSDLEVDGNEIGEENVFSCTCDARGAITATTSEMGDDVRRMLSPIVFVYPSSSIKMGDKWTFDFKPKKDGDEGMASWSYEVKGSEKVGDVDALKISSKFAEKGTSSMNATGNWWLAKDGRILKFDVDIKSWVVPMAGPETVNAVIKGELTK